MMWVLAQGCGDARNNRNHSQQVRGRQKHNGGREERNRHFQMRDGCGNLGAQELDSDEQRAP